MDHTWLSHTSHNASVSRRCQGLVVSTKPSCQHLVCYLANNIKPFLVKHAADAAIDGTGRIAVRDLQVQLNAQEISKMHRAQLNIL